MKKIIIAIDGFSSCGKSTMAKALARNIGYLYFDSGAMYRAVALFCMQNGLIENGEINTVELKERLGEIHISFEADPQTRNSLTMLNGVNVEHEIRTIEVSRHVSQVAALDFVRSEMVGQQREMGKMKGIVMDGRDIGTVVLPDAELKIYLTADARVRAQRRFAELKQKGVEANFDDVLAEMEQRDWQDMNREIAPLRKADDAVLVDTSEIDFEESFHVLCELVITKLAINQEV